MAIDWKFGRRQSEGVWNGKGGFVVANKGAVQFYPAQAASPTPAYQCEMQQNSEGVLLRVLSGDRVVFQQQFSGASLVGAIKAFEGWKKRFLTMAGVTPLWRRVLIGAGIALLLIMLWPTGYHANPGSLPPAAAPAPQGSALPYLPPAYGQQAEAAPSGPPAVGSPTSASSTPAHFSKELMSEIAAQHGIEMGNPKGKTFYVFESTTCESCQDLDSKMAEIGKQWHVVELPVGFDSIALKQAAGAYCAKDPAAALHDAMTGLVNTSATACKSGLQDVDQNNRLFIKLGLTATPILVSASGNVAVGTASADKVEAWLSSH